MKLRRLKEKPRKLKRELKEKLRRLKTMLSAKLKRLNVKLTSRYLQYLRYSKTVKSLNLQSLLIFQSLTNLLTATR